MSDHALANGSTVDKEPANPFLNTVEAARLLKLKPKTLENMRWKGEGPRNQTPQYIIQTRQQPGRSTPFHSTRAVGIRDVSGCDVPRDRRICRGPNRNVGSQNAGQTPCLCRLGKSSDTPRATMARA